MKRQELELDSVRSTETPELRSDSRVVSRPGLGELPRIGYDRSCETDRAMTPTVENIWNEFAAKLGRFIRARVADPATAQDILQDVFVRLQSQIDEFRDPAKVQGWLYLVARNSIMDHLRTRKETTEVPEARPAEPPAHDAEV